MNDYGDDKYYWNTTLSNIIENNTSSNCLSVNHTETIEMMKNGSIKTWNLDLDIKAFNTIRTKGFGCFACPYKNETFDKNSPNPYSFILSDHNNGIPSIKMSLI